MDMIGKVKRMHFRDHLSFSDIARRTGLSRNLPAEVFAAYSNGGYAGATQVASIRPRNGSKLLYNALLGAKAGVPQTYDFFNGEDKNAVIRATLAQAMAELMARFAYLLLEK